MDFRIDITTIRIQGTLQKRDGWLATYLYNLFKGISVFIAVMTHKNVPVHDPQKCPCSSQALLIRIVKRVNAIVGLRCVQKTIIQQPNKQSYQTNINDIINLARIIIRV